MNPLFYSPSGYVPSKQKATNMMEGLLLDEYQNSPNLKEYMGCFLAELDILFEELDNVYFGRFLEHAIGVQLDVIGVILGQSRAVALPNTWFGFSDNGSLVDNPGVDGFSDEATPTDGGRFRSEESEGFEIIPLDDFTYRKVLLVKALCNNRPVSDINSMYFIIQVLLGIVPRTMEITSPETQTVVLDVSEVDVSNQDVSLIRYMSKYFITTGTTFIINRI